MLRRHPYRGSANHRPSVQRGGEGIAARRRSVVFWWYVGAVVVAAVVAVQYPAKDAYAATVKAAARKTTAPTTTSLVKSLFATPTATVSSSSGTTIPAGTSATSDPVPKEIYFSSDRTGDYEIWAMRLDGSRLRQVTFDKANDDWWPRPSPDRSRIVFYKTPAGVHDLDYSQASLWAVNGDGSFPTVLRAKGTDGWVLQGHAEWVPDGSGLVMFGGRSDNPQIVLTDRGGKVVRALTSRPGTNLDPSFAPDGRSVAFVGCAQAICYPDNYEIYRLMLADGTTTRITSDALSDHDPYISPDGQTIAWLTEITPGSRGVTPVWDVRLALLSNTSGQRRLYGDTNITSRPVWESNTSILVHRIVIGSDPAFQVYRVKPDGTSSQRLTNLSATSEYPG